MKEEVLMDKTSSFEEIIERDGSLVYTVQGYSMKPLLKQHEDLVVIKKITEPLKKYDVILFKRNNKYILHRILKVNVNSYDTAGDHNWWKEYDVKPSEIIGILSAIIKDGKEITPEDPAYQAYVHLWCDVYPVRFGILKAGRLVRKVFSKVLR